MQTVVLKGAGLVEQTVAAFTARRRFGKLLRDVETRGDKIVVERNGQPVAAVVPIELYHQWKKRREAFFEQMREIARRVNVSPAEADRLAQEAVEAVRAVS